MWNFDIAIHPAYLLAQHRHVYPYQPFTLYQSHTQQQSIKVENFCKADWVPFDSNMKEIIIGVNETNTQQNFFTEVCDASYLRPTEYVLIYDGYIFFKVLPDNKLVSFHLNDSIVLDLTGSSIGWGADE
jgi:hypothetical protein